jgi:plastocyanin
MNKFLLHTLLGSACLLSAGVTLAAEESVTFTIKDHVFTPASAEVPAGKKIKLVIKNLDTTPEEFESSDLHREKLVPAGKEITLNVGPLKPGTYRFEGEYNPKTAQGTLVAK